MGIYTVVGNGLASGVDVYVNQTSAAIITLIAPIVGLGVTIWIINYGLAVTRGQAQAPVMDFTWKATKIAMILGLGLSVGTYQSQIVPVVKDVFFSLSKIVSLQGSSNCNFSASQIFDMIDCNASIATNFAAAFNNAYQNLGTLDFLKAIPQMITFVVCWLLLCLGLTIFYVVLAVEVIYCYLALHLLLGIGPLFICAAAFEPTKKYFDGWLSKIGYLCIFSMLLFAFLGMSVSIVDSTLSQVLPGATQVGADAAVIATSQGIDPIGASLTILALFLILAWLGTRISGIAGALSSSSPSGSSAATFVGGMIARNFINRMGKGNAKNNGGGGAGGSITGASSQVPQSSKGGGSQTDATRLQRLAAKGREMVKKRNG